MRTSSRIVWKRKLALALERKKEKINNLKTTNKEKGKAIINDEVHLEYFNEYWIRSN